ncbi:uncharacterized protein TNCV_578341 [Trichonephila clavipes]|nr:uncharacterized protein TNCV_578341 [Trichonephila clavipes]
MIHLAINTARRSACSFPPDNQASLKLAQLELSENESDGGELSCSNLDFNEDIRLSESDCEKSKESADEIDNIPANPDIYVARDGPECIPHNGSVHGRFVTRNVLRQSSGPTSFAKHNDNVTFLCYKGP